MDLTIVMVTHDLDTLVALSDRIAVLAEQKVIAAANERDVAMCFTGVRHFLH